MVAGFSNAPAAGQEHFVKWRAFALILDQPIGYYLAVWTALASVLAQGRRSMSSTSLSTPRGPAWWREWEVLLLLLLVLAGYFFRASDMNLRGEEPRRAQVAVEMIERGDWVVPRQQGDKFLSRPPMQNWLIALSFLGLGERDTFGARLPSMLATLGIVLILYGYGRTFLSRSGALAAAAVYGTFGEIFQTGRMAETEAVFIFFVAGALLLWHWGIVRQWPAYITWSLGYALMACGALTKGPQAPVYFVGSVTAYCLLSGRWRQLFSLAHLAGILVAVAILLPWHVLLYLRLGVDDVWRIWISDTAPRLLFWEGLLRHLGQFPIEVFGSLMPWSPLLLLFFRKDLRHSVGQARPQVAFLAVSIGLCFPTCWLPPDGQTRYVAPLYPLIAALIGFVVQRCGEALPGSSLANDWRRYLALMAGMMVLVAAGIGISAFVGNSPKFDAWAEPPLFATLFVGAALGTAWLARRVRAADVRRRTGWAVVAIAGFMVVLFNGPVLSARIRRSEDPPGEVAKLKENLPDDVELVSVGIVDAYFQFLWGPLIEQVPSPERIPEGAYFCFQQNYGNRPALPFAWEQEAAISMDRNHSDQPHNILVVARRLH
jgi:4-amino-4-deoxy-L-arabinose transferase-like glycosyltransferase